MGLADDFTSVSRSDGLPAAGRWVARRIALSVFHSWAYGLANAASPLVCDRQGLERRFEDNGTIERYDRDRVVEIDPPPGEDHHAEIRDRVGATAISRPFVGTLEDAALVGAYPVVLDHDGRLVLEAVVSPEVMTLNVGYSVLEYLSDPWPRRDATTPASIDTAVLLYNRWNRGYFHWTTETLSRLEGVEAYRERTGETPKLVVGPDLTRFQLQSLALLGYDRDDLIRWDRRRASVDRLVVPTVRRELNPGETSPLAHWWLRERMREAAEEAAPGVADEAADLVYVSREDAPRRRVLNEAAVLDLLEDYGFEKYVLSERSVAENVQLFAQADVVVAPHGAGLTDVVYADDATVVELFRANQVQPVYFVLSRQVGLDYRYLLCDYEGPNIVVDVGELEAVVSEAVESGQVAYSASGSTSSPST